MKMGTMRESIASVLGIARDGSAYLFFLSLCFFCRLRSSPSLSFFFLSSSIQAFL